MHQRFTDRTEAGKRLGEELAPYAGMKNAVVLALPRGGVPIAHEVARILALPMDIWLVRKLGVPGQEEFAMGAIASGGICHMNQATVRLLGISDDEVHQIIQEEQLELQRRSRLYRGDRAEPDLKGKTIILVDDGAATGLTMSAAVQALRQTEPARIIAAIPVASSSACDELRLVADEVICPRKPEPFYGVGQWYINFSQISDAEVQLILEMHRPPLSDLNRFEDSIISKINMHAVPLKGNLQDYDAIIHAAADKKFVLIGEATHGTEEFYRARADITRRLIRELNFDAIAVEADWPDAWRVHRYVTSSYLSQDKVAEEALAGFERFPTWMWRNEAVKDFVEYLHDHNQSTHGRSPVGFYGLDLYSLRSSSEAVIAYLEKTDPVAARRARERYACLDQFMENPQAYGYAASLQLVESCEQKIIAQLAEFQKKTFALLHQEGFAEEEYFCAEQNAKLVSNAEAYYRSLFQTRPHSWNVRDRHMFDTLEDLAAHLEMRLGRSPRIAVWAHNSHVGNSAATEMAERGEFNIGQLVREKYGHAALLIGFSTSRGTVTAASDWDGMAERKVINTPLPGSYEELFDKAEPLSFLLDLRSSNAAVDMLREKRLQRAIGVIYRPETERQSHYFHSHLPYQFDFILHYDTTTALLPLEERPVWRGGDMDETYPFGV